MFLASVTHTIDCTRNYSAERRVTAMCLNIFSLDLHMLSSKVSGHKSLVQHIQRSSWSKLEMIEVLFVQQHIHDRQIQTCCSGSTKVVEQRGDNHTANAVAWSAAMQGPTLLIVYTLPAQDSACTLEQPLLLCARGHSF